MTTKTIFDLLRGQKKISALLIATTLMWAIGLPMWINGVNAASVTSFSDTLSDSDLDVVSNHTIRFTTSGTGQLVGGENFTVTFESGFSLPNTLSANDFDLQVGGANQPLDDAAASGATWQVSVSTTTRTVTLTSGTATIGTSTSVALFIGTNATTSGAGVDQITNPNSAQSYTVTIGGSMDDSGTTRIVILNDVTVTASVDTTFTFNIYGVASNTVPITGEASTTASTTATGIPFGNLTSAVPGIAAQRLEVTTNAKNGFSVTIQQDHNLESASAADIDTFMNGTSTSTPTSWAQPLGVPGSENTYGHYGITTTDSGLSGGNTFSVGLGATKYVGDFGAAAPREIFYANSVVSGTSTYVGVKIETSALQEAANDYTNTLTYVATPVF